MKKEQILFALLAICFIGFVYPKLENNSNGTSLLPISKEKALESLKITVLDKTRQWDQKVSVAYTNLSDSYVFKLTQTGLRYSESNREKDKYLVRRTPVVIPPHQTIELELSIPFLIKPKVAYPLKDDVIVDYE